MSRFRVGLIIRRAGAFFAIKNSFIFPDHPFTALESNPGGIDCTYIDPHSPFLPCTDLPQKHFTLHWFGIFQQEKNEKSKAGNNRNQVFIIRDKARIACVCVLKFLQW